MIEEELKNQETMEEANPVSEEPVANDSLDSKEETANEVVDDKKKGKKKKSKARNAIEWILTGIFAALFLVAGIGQIDGMMNAKKHYGQYIRLGFGSFLVLTNSMDPVYKQNAALITYNESADTIYKKYLANKEYNDAKTNEFVASHPEVLDESDKIDKENETWKAFEKTLKCIDITFVGVNKGLVVTPSDETLIYQAYPNNPVPVTHRLREIQVRDEVAKGSGHYIFICAGINTGGELAKANQYQAFTENELLGVVKVGSQFLGTCFRVLSSPWGLLVFLLVPALYLIITSALDILKALKDPSEAKETSGAPSEAPKGDGNDVLSGLSEKDKERLKKEMLEQMINERNQKK